MIDTGCQVTILATSVFEWMCEADPQVSSRLRLCGRRLVSVDLFPFIVKGELELDRPTDRQQTAFDALKACLLGAPILGFPTADGRFLLDTDTSLFAVGGVLNQIQDNREVVIVYASRSVCLSQR